MPLVANNFNSSQF